MMGAAHDVSSFKPGILNAREVAEERVFRDLYEL